jgi:hypothetical protein
LVVKSGSDRDLNSSTQSHSHIDASCVVVARRDPSTLFDPIEEPFDQVARTVEVRAEAEGLVAIASRRNVGAKTPQVMPIASSAAVQRPIVFRGKGDVASGCPNDAGDPEATSQGLRQH